MAINFDIRLCRSPALQLTTMNAEYPIVDDHAQGQEIKHVGEVLPDDRRSVFPYTFRVKSVCLRGTTASMHQETKLSLYAIESCSITSCMRIPSSFVLKSYQDARHFSSPFFVRPPLLSSLHPVPRPHIIPPAPPHRRVRKAMQGLVYLLFVGASTSSEKGQS